MLITLLAWIYITFLCWTWGILFIKLINRITRNKIASHHFSIISLIGLSLITIVAGVLSLLIPLGNWWVQFFFILPCMLLFFQKNGPYFFPLLKKQFTSLNTVSIILLSACLLLILIMSTWKIVHPDTLGYHAQTMQWIEKYKAVPGLVHLHVRFGYQGLWFVDSALFDFSFIGKQSITFLNSTVLVWFLIFIINRIDVNFYNGGKTIFGLLWLVFFALTMWSYTQVRLTATSASPDFVATLFVLSAIYLLLEKSSKHLAANDWLIAALLSIVAVTIKLSVAPILIIAIAAASLLLIARNFKIFFVLMIFATIAFSAFITRNIISSGYVIFPSTAIDIVNVDWKYNKELTANEKNYITAYAKKSGVATREEIDFANKSRPTEWIPDWWQNRSMADKTIFILFGISVLAALFFLKKIIQQGFIPLLVILTMITGIIFWFVNAPDPRFGFGFILGLISTVAFLLSSEKEISIERKVLHSLLVGSSVIVFVYTGYRFKNFFKVEQSIFSLGIERSEYKTFDCDKVKINSPVNSEFGVTPTPCTDLDCTKFSSRGNKVSDGFRAKSNP
jgi:hypothetical protein